MKKMISICLSLSLMASLLVLPAGASATESEMTQVVQALGIMVGDENGNMNLGQNVSRAQFASMVIRATPGGDSVSQTAYAPFPDVAASHWSAPYVTVAVQMGYISGYTDGTFQPDNTITLAEGLTMVLKILGYGTEYFVGTYPDAQMALGKQLGLTDDLSVSNSSDVLDRGDAMTIFYNAMTATTASGAKYITTLGYALDGDGEVDVTALLYATMDGPVIAEGSWADKVDVNLSTATIWKNGKTISSSLISDYDVIYWNEYLNTAWVYSDRVTGTVQTIAPSTTAPTSVMVAGQSYGLSGTSATYAFSQLGAYGVGDTVTLLLGRDGTVVGVTDTAIVSVDKVGMVSSLGKSTYDSGSYTADSITILATDGNYYSYPATTTYYDVGDVVRITASATGAISVTRASSTSTSGTVSEDGTMLGKLTFADNVEILDIYSDATLAGVTYASRLAGTTLSKTDIAYIETDSNGDICKLVLNDVTGDLHDYLVITDAVTVTESAYGLSVYSYYYITMGDVDTVLSFSTKAYTTKTGPAMIEGGVSDTQGITILSSMALTHTAGQYAYQDSTGYLMADDVQIYEKDGSDYYVTTLERAGEAGLSLTAYYDKLPSAGGRIRIIIAQ